MEWISSNGAKIVLKEDDIRRADVNAIVPAANSGRTGLVPLPPEGAEPRETQSHVMLALNFFDGVRRRVAGSGK